MNIEQGLFQFDLTDYHAILGVALDADAKAIRKRYLKIARKLHPDSLRDSTSEDRQKANELLSKMVNPAYESLTQEKVITEHMIVLRLRGQRLSRDTSVTLQSEAAQAIAQSNNASSAYVNSLQTLAEEQYEAIDQVLDVIGQISELNLAYLMCTSGGSGSGAKPANPAASSTSRSPAATSANSTSPRQPAAPPPSPKQQREAIIESYQRRAASFAAKKEYSRAILEMRDAIKSNPTNGQCHAQLAAYYLQAGQAKMAKIHLKRALELAPDNTLARELEPKLNQATGSQTTRNSSAKSAPPKSKGGLFGLFGGKQK
ncbi:J domain-containing protein [Halomicronema sp. CCY15110]|uniref:J domain-containing protein n=1 Tax=Halomicronema sp. CCY15110 TaxID=2767773 RepID=UPI00194DCD37|nr:J domain-containing protein [Halomicronema sp. CCY15110]